MTDKTELKRLASLATPGRNFDRIPAAGGGLKYECTGDDGSLVLKVDHKNGEWGFVGDNGAADEEFFLACTPAAVLAMIATVEHLSSREDVLENLCDARFRINLDLETECDQLKAAIATPESVFANLKAGKIPKPSLRSMIDLYGEVVNGEDAQLLEIAKLRAENEALREDAGRYRWITHGPRADYCWNHVLSELDREGGDWLESAIDAARGKGELS